MQAWNSVDVHESMAEYAASGVSSFASKVNGGWLYQRPAAGFSAAASDARSDHGSATALAFGLPSLSPLEQLPLPLLSPGSQASVSSAAAAGATDKAAEERARLTYERHTAAAAAAAALAALPGSTLSALPATSLASGNAWSTTSGALANPAMPPTAAEAQFAAEARAHARAVKIARQQQLRRALAWQERQASRGRSSGGYNGGAGAGSAGHGGGGFVMPGPRGAPSYDSAPRAWYSPASAVNTGADSSLGPGLGSHQISGFAAPQHFGQQFPARPHFDGRGRGRRSRGTHYADIYGAGAGGDSGGYGAGYYPPPASASEVARQALAHAGYGGPPTAASSSHADGRCTRGGGDWLLNEANLHTLLASTSISAPATVLPPLSSPLYSPPGGGLHDAGSHFVAADDPT